MLFAALGHPQATRIDVRILIAFVAVLSIGLTARSAHAQEGDARRGFALARQVCAECHAVRRDQASPNPDAPEFETIASVPGMTAMALQAALQTSHDSMPNLILPNPERADVVAYILSLKPN
jgi:mono/diheme cytochrome c family protein